VKRLVSLLITLSLVLVILFAGLPPGSVEAHGENWLGDYLCRRALEISPQDGAGTLYPIKIEAVYGTASWDGWSYELTNPVIHPTVGEGENFYAWTGYLEDRIIHAWWGAYWMDEGVPIGDAIIYGTSEDYGLTWDYDCDVAALLPSDTGWDSLQVNDPSVVEVDDTYFMYYSGTIANGCEEIGVATATSPEGPWTKYSGNPVLAMNYSAAEVHCARPSVIYEDGLFRMWYDARQAGTPWGKITGFYYATSTDGFNWTRHQQVVASDLPKTLGNPEVRRYDDSTLMMIGTDNNPDPPWDPHQHFWTSVDGLTWTLYPDVVAAEGDWHPYGSGGAGLLLVGGSMWMFYGGVTNPDLCHQHIGLARLSSTTLAFDGLCRTDFGDVRFTDDDGHTELDYWLDGDGTEEGVSATFWVEVLDSLSSGTQTIYAYFGDSAGTTTSSMVDTFLFADDFDRADNATVGNDWTESTSHIDVEMLDVERLGGVDEACSHDFGQTVSTVYEIKAKVSNMGGNFNIWWIPSTPAHCGGFTMDGGGPDEIKYSHDGGYVAFDGDYIANTYYKMSGFFDSSDNTWDYWLDDVLVAEDRLGSGCGSDNTVYLQTTFANMHSYVDWVIVRKHLDPGPVLGAWSPLEMDPVVETQAAINIGVTSAKLKGYVEFSGGQDCWYRFNYGLTDSYGTNTDWSLEDDEVSAGDRFNTLITGLEPDTLYHFRAQCATYFGLGSGEDLTFTTYDTPGVPSALRAIPISATEIALSWVKGAGGPQTAIRWQAGSSPSDYGEGTLVYRGEATSYVFTGLTPGTTYFFSAWGYDEPGYYSPTYDTALATTYASATGIAWPDEPGTYFDAPDISALTDAPGYGLMAYIGSHSGMGVARFFQITFLIVVGGVSIGCACLTRSVLATIVLTFALMAAGVGMGVVPLALVVLYVGISGMIAYMRGGQAHA